MDGLSVTKIKNIIKDRYEGAQLARIGVTEDSLFMGIYSKEHAVIGVQVTGGKPSILYKQEMEGLPDKILDRLKGGTIREVGGRKYDRLMWLDIDKRRPSGKIESNRLVFELIGKMANVVLLNESGIIIWQFCKNNADGDRDFGVGEKYQQPKLNKQQTLAENCGKSFMDLLGFYGVTAKEAEKYLDNNYSFDETCTIIEESLKEDEFYFDNKGRLIPFKPVAGKEFFTFEALEKEIGSETKASRDVYIKNRLVKYFEKQADKYLRLREQLEKELDAALEYDKHEKKGDLLKSNIHLLKNAKKGKIILDEYSFEGINKVEYEVPELFDVNKEINRLYKKSEKLERSIPLLEKRIEEIDNIVDSALEQLYFIEISAADDELRELASEIKKQDNKHRKQIKEKQFDKYEIGGGTAYLGRNSVTNHRLVFQFANPSDWWFHAQKIPSAHLVFRKSTSPTPEEIEKCAAIVAAKSKAKSDLKVTIDYTQKKNVKKPKNTPPGFVIYHRFKTIIVEPDKSID